MSPTKPTHQQKGKNADFYLRFPDQINLQQIMKRSQRLNANYAINTANRIKSKSSSRSESNLLFIFLFLSTQNTFIQHTFPLADALKNVFRITFWKIYSFCFWWKNFSGKERSLSPSYRMKRPSEVNGLGSDGHNDEVGSDKADTSSTDGSSQSTLNYYRKGVLQSPSVPRMKNSFFSLTFLQRTAKLFGF